MKLNYLALLLLPALALGACGGAETETNHDAPRPARSEAAPLAEPGGFGAPADEAAPAAEPRVEESPAASAPAPSRPAAQPAEPERGSAPAAAEPGERARSEAEAIMRRVERAYADVRSMQADFVQHLSVPLLGTEQRSAGTLYQRKPDRFLMRFSDPAGDVMVADGEFFWMYNPSIDRTQVLRTRMGDGRGQVDLQQEFLSNPNQRFVATLIGSETVDERTTHVLTLVPRTRSQYKLVKVWVDQRDHLVRRFEMTEENESVRRLELRNLRLNVDLADSLFRFSPPAGTQVFDA